MLAANRVGRSSKGSGRSAISTRHQVTKSDLAEKFAAWIKRFSVDKGIKVNDLFRFLDYQVMIDPSVAWSVTRSGVRAEGLDSLIQLLNLPSNESAAELIGASHVTLWRWVRDKKALPSVHTEQILRAMELQLLATEVFGGVDKAQTWLGQAHPVLDGIAPRDYASNEYGAQKVRGMLASLRYGGVV